MRVRLAIAFCLLAILGAPAAAVFAPSLFSDLRVELTRRRDQDFAGALAKRQKRQRAAVLSAIDAIAKRATNLTYDVKVARSMQAALAKAYPEEFGGATGPTQLEPLFLALFDGLTGALQAERSSLEVGQPLLDVKSARRMAPLVAAADAALAANADLSPTDFKRRGKRLAAAASALVKATVIVDKAPPSGLHALIDGVPWESSGGASVTNIFGDQTLYIVGVRNGVGGSREVIEVFVRPITGPGTYPLNDPSRLRGGFRTETANGTPTVWSIVPGTGSLTVARFDFQGKRVRLNFSFKAENPVAGLKEITNAALNVAEEDVSVQAGNAF